MWLNENGWLLRRLAKRVGEKFYKTLKIIKRSYNQSIARSKHWQKITASKKIERNNHGGISFKWLLTTIYRTKTSNTYEKKKNLNELLWKRINIPTKGVR